MREAAVAGAGRPPTPRDRGPPGGPCASFYLAAVQTNGCPAVSGRRPRRRRRSTVNLSDCLERHDLDGRHDFYAGALPAPLVSGQQQLEDLWGLHPEDFHEILIHGRMVKTP